MAYKSSKRGDFYKDKKGYTRHNSHSNAWHRKVAYHKIYLKNRKKYKLPFSKYEIHHKDGDKNNNNPSNLALLTPEEHIDVHLEHEENRKKAMQEIREEMEVERKKIAKRKIKLKTIKWIIFFAVPIIPLIFFHLQGFGGEIIVSFGFLIFIAWSLLWYIFHPRRY